MRILEKSNEDASSFMGKDQEVASLMGKAGFSIRKGRPVPICG